MKKQAWKLENVAGILLLCSGLYLLGKMAGFCFSEDIWYDEVFSAGMMRYSYKEIVEFTAKDVHPPFYYWYLKTFVSVGQFFFQQMNAVILAKLASMLPMAGLWILAVTKIRKEFGLLIAGIFVFCVYTMPQLTAYGLEIRMYSFALLWVTLAFFFAYGVYKTRKISDFMGLFFSGILTAYTQYFSCIAIVLLYLIVGVAIFKDKIARKRWGICVISSVLCYLPWLETFIQQFTTVSGSYWIPPLTLRSFAGCVKYIYLPSGGYPTLNYILAGVMIFATFLLGILFLKKRGQIKNWFAQEGFSVLLGLGMLGGLIFIGVGVSIVISPIFVYRYMIPCLGGFWFVFAFLLKDCDNKWIWIPVLLLTVYIGRMNVNGVFWEENNKIVQMPNTIEALECIQEDDVMVFNFNHVQAVVGFYKENESYLLYQEAEPLIQEIYRDYGMIEDVTQIKELLQQGKKVWFLGSFVSREDIVEEWKQQGLKITEMGSYLLERYWFNLYSVE